MPESSEIWKFLAGLGLFLFGMNQLEVVIQSLSGRKLKLFLKHNTQNLFKAITGGAIVTGIVQSSSVVSLIVLAFVETGIIRFRSALGIILGANLGTTLSSWIVATVGFKLDVIGYALPVIAVSGMGIFFFEKRKKIYNLFLFLFALGILFLGLGFIKESALKMVAGVDLKTYTDYGIFVFILIGFVFTTIIQSSSATVAITLTAIFAGALTFPSAAAIVIGSEIGTTIKILIWGMKGSADKKRVAWGNFIYNLFTASIAIVLLHWLIYLITNIIGIKDPLIGLVFFQTSINIISIILIIPFLNTFSSWLESKFLTDSINEISHFSKNLTTLPVLATEVLRKETLKLYMKIVFFNKQILCQPKPPVNGILENIKSFGIDHIDLMQEYNRIKQTEGELLGYYSKINKNNFNKDDALLLVKYLNTARQAVAAAKALKDIQHNLSEFEVSVNDFLHHQCSLLQKDWLEFDKILNELLKIVNQKELKQILEENIKKVIAQEEDQKAQVISRIKMNQLSEFESSTLMNVLHEVLASKKHLLYALEGMEIESLPNIKNENGLKVLNDN